MENKIVNNVLGQNIDFLTRHLVLSPTVLEKLTENGLISEVVKRQLAFQDTDEQIPFLIQSFTSRGLLALKKFLAVLKETGHGWMVDVLLNAQALSFEEIASTQGPEYGQASRLPVEMSKLRGLTPEDARMRLTSASLKGRGGQADYGARGLDIGPRSGVGEVVAQGSGILGRADRGLGGMGIGDRGLGVSNYGTGLPDRGLGGMGMADRGVGINGIGDRSLVAPAYGSQGVSALRDRGLGDYGLGNRGVGGTVGMGGGMAGGLADGMDWRNPPLAQDRDLKLRHLLDRPLAAESAGHYRGQVQPRLMLDNSLQAPVKQTPVEDSFGDVTGALVNLHGHFKSQSDTNEQTLSVLKQEEEAIKELLQQNTRDQVKVKRNQNALGDIGRRLEEINVRTNDVYDPITHSHLSRYRLQQLNMIPWSSEK